MNFPSWRWAAVLRRVTRWRLDALYRVHRFGVEGGESVKREALKPHESADLDRRFAEQLAGLKESERWLRVALQRYPFWVEGHLSLGSLALRQDDVGTAYAAGQAALKLSAEGELAERGRALLGRAFLRRGEGKRAIEMFERCLQCRAGDVAIREDLGAAYLLEGDYASTVRVLESAAPGALSGEGQAALAYARKRLSGAGS